MTLRCETFARQCANNTESSMETIVDTRQASASAAILNTRSLNDFKSTCSICARLLLRGQRMQGFER